MDLVLNNLQRLICHKTQQTNLNPTYCWVTQTPTALYGGVKKTIKKAKILRKSSILIASAFYILNPIFTLTHSQVPSRPLIKAYVIPLAIWTMDGKSIMISAAVITSL